MKIDLNSDMGEGFGPYRLCDDEAMMKVVSSANIACGFHGGDPDTMARMVRLAKQNGVGIGAHLACLTARALAAAKCRYSRTSCASRCSTNSVP